MAKKSNALYYVAAAVVVLIIAVFLLKGPADVQPEAPVVAEPTTPVEVAEPETVLPEAVVPTEIVGEASLVDNVACVNGKISGKLTNTEDKTVVLVKTMKVLLRGLVVKEHGCDKSELMPGESTVCTSLDGGFPLQDGQNEIAVRVGDKEVIATVTC